jgi:hypothetical protein
VKSLWINTLVLYGTEIITAVKGLAVQAPAILFIAFKGAAWQAQKTSWHHCIKTVPSAVDAPSK